MPLTADFTKGNQWGPGRLDEAVYGHNELREGDLDTAKKKSAYFAFPKRIQWLADLSAGYIDSTKLVAARNAAFAWLDQNSTGRWHLDDDYDAMTSPLKLYIERATDQAAFLAAFLDQFEAREATDAELADACTALGLLPSLREEFKQWINDNDAYSFRKDEDGAAIFTFHYPPLQQKFIDANAAHYELQFIADNVCRIDLKGQQNFPLQGLQFSHRAYDVTVNGYHVRYPEFEEKLRTMWGDHLEERGKDDEGRTIFRFHENDADNKAEVVATYRRYVEGDFEWPELLRRLGLDASRRAAGPTPKNP